MPWQIFGISFLVSLSLIPILRRVGIRLNMVAKPKDDRWHKKPVPVLGGVALFLAYSISLFASGSLGEIGWQFWLVPGVMFVLGLYDDIKPVNPPTKLIIQILASSIILFFGYVIDFFPWEIANILLTFFWLVGITNAINLLDNMDGLAGGVSLIAAGFISYFYWQSGSAALLAVSLALAGGVLAFLVYNFPPAKVFMGDSGSLFLGFSLAALTIARRPRASNIIAVMGPPIMLFLLPILDTVLVTITRILRGQSPARGGQDHTSHRLVAFGLSERQAVLVLYGIALISGVASTVVEALDYEFSLFLIPIVLVSAALLAAYLGRLRVVTSPTPARVGGITQLMVDLTYRRRLFEVVLDFFLISLAFYLAFWTRFGFNLDGPTLNVYVRTLPFALSGVFISYILFGVYRGVWRYVGVDDLLRYFRAVVGGALLAGVAGFVFYPRDTFTPVVYVLFMIFLYLGLAASRSSFRVLDRIYDIQAAQAQQNSVLIFGAGDAGEVTLLWILRNPQLGYRPVGFLDTDPLKWGRRIHGVDVFGDIDRLANVISDQEVDGIIIAQDDLGDMVVPEHVSELLRTNGIWVRQLRLEFELLEENLLTV